MKAHFIDIDILIKTDFNAWIVDKKNPNNPILKIKPYEFNLFKSGIYKSQNNKIEFNGKEFWLSNDFMNNLKILVKKNKIDISDLGISLQEFLNKDLIDTSQIEIDLSVLRPIFNTDDDIYIISSKNSKNRLETQIEKLESKMSEMGLKIKDFYFISETFYNRNEDEIAYSKSKLLLQHLLGFKTEDDKFIDTKVKNYDEVYFYDDEKNSIETSKRINIIFQKLLTKTEETLQKQLQENCKDKILNIKQATNNKVNPFLTTKVMLDRKIVKTFESFKYFYK